MNRLLLLSIALLPLAACVPAGSDADGELPSVAATFYPLAQAAQRVGGGHIELRQITPAGAEPHDFEPTPRDIAFTEDADLLLRNGGGVDAWADEIAVIRKDAGEPVLTFLETVEPLRLDDEADDEHAEEHGHAEGGLDPHAWLDPLRMRALVLALGVQLASIDPANAEDYRRNADAYAAELEALDHELEAGLASCERQEIVVAHDAFGYVADRYDLHVHGIAGLSPEEEPSPQRMAEIAAMVREEGITTIFFETLTSPRLAETIAREAGAKTAVLNPLEGLSDADIAAGRSYASVMRENLSALRTALACR